MIRCFTICVLQHSINVRDYGMPTAMFLKEEGKYQYSFQEPEELSLCNFLLWRLKSPTADLKVASSLKLPWSLWLLWAIGQIYGSELIQHSYTPHGIRYLVMWYVLSLQDPGGQALCLSLIYVPYKTAACLIIVKAPKHWGGREQSLKKKKKAKMASRQTRCSELRTVYLVIRSSFASIFWGRKPKCGADINICQESSGSGVVWIVEDEAPTPRRVRPPGRNLSTSSHHTLAWGLPKYVFTGCRHQRNPRPSRWPGLPSEADTEDQTRSPGSLDPVSLSSF